MQKNGKKQLDYENWSQEIDKRIDILFRYLVVNYNQLRQYFQIGLGEIKGHRSSMKEDQHQKNTVGGKNKKIRKKKSAPDKKSNYHLRIQTSIVYDSEIQESVPDTAAIRQYKQQLNFVKNLMSQVVNKYNFCNQTITQKIDAIKKQLTFPAISIDKLFDHKKTTIFDDGYISNDLTDYLKLVNNQLQQKHKKIILTFHHDSFVIIQDSNKRQETQEFKGRFITLLERQVFQNRQNFIEKIKLNQSKYQQSNSQLSEISQELLFLSKTYMENNAKIKKIGQQIALKMSTYFSQPQFETQKLYYEIIMKKNIAYAVREHQLDFLNYFRRKEHEQRTFYVEMPQIKNDDQFFSYLKSKKPKKGKLAKYGLHTACSCCFSGYFEAYNPLIACENCNLRCHKLCYNLKQKTCGNCSYQRLLKTDKQVVPHCMICKQKGEMTIKLRDKVYAHAFCLIVHDQWKIQLKKELNQQKKELQKECESYYNKNSKPSYTSNQCPKFHQKKYELLFKDIWTDMSSSQTLEEQPKNTLENLDFQMDCQMKNQENQVCSQDKFCQSQTCKICSSGFHRDFYGQCVECKKKSHAFCAFFEGFEFRDLGKGTKEEEKSNRVNILFDCCLKSIQEKEKMKRSREFVLNRNRYLFDGI